MSNFETLKLSRTNCYLLKCRKGYCLIDCGSSQDKDLLIEKLKDLNININDISYLILTHHHNDHCGLLDFLVSENRDLKIIMSRKCSEFLKDGKHHKHANERYSNRILKFIMGLYIRFSQNWSESFVPFISRESDYLFETDNDTLLPELGINGKLLLTPGHTEDSLSIIVGGTAFVGDAARNILNFTGTPFQPILLYNLSVCTKSWEKLAASGARTLCPAHGSPFYVNKLNF
ncbi:MAG: MBL fold metallo-hydrolase [Peptococcaceae bacterium]|nr:MBL fold metallo-hydrolase [Peptococcaceae bacterium]